MRGDRIAGRLLWGTMNSVKSTMSMSESQPQPAALKVTVYSPESQMRHPLDLVGMMFRDVWAARGLAWRLFVRDNSALYRQSLLGYGWALLPPVVTTLTWTLLSRGNIINVSATPVAYPAYVMCGTMLWQLFFQSLLCPMTSLVKARSMLAKLNFPREAIVLAGLGEVLFNFCIQLLMLIPVFIFYNVPVGPSLLLAPVGVAGLLVLGLSLGLVLAPVGMLYKDIGNTIRLLGTFWMLLTPVVYPPGREGVAVQLAFWNPVSPVLVTARDWLTSGTATYPVGFWLVSGCAVALMFAGWMLFRLAMPIVIERSGN
jgi:lipopolysaccharide transport system permease protein